MKEKKTTFQRVVEKFEIGIEKNELRRHWNVVEKSQKSESNKVRRDSTPNSNRRIN